ncbi:E3 SUMO-protein ligase MMS21 [Primulina huaijiensis]|uniref:E3 SUMO-protein ligase MMS21 n=1 Tax=Primulina huaijiensis TaxID=1492673 RepID=UPI003CC73321
MASTSAPRSNAAHGRIKSAASTLFSDNQTILAEIRKALIMMKEIAVDLEKDHESEMVKKLEDGVLELLEASDNCTHLSNAIQSVGNEFQPGVEPNNFSKLLDDKVERLKAASASASQNNPILRQFREAIWNVHHTGQPLPGDELEDIVMTSTECNLLNVTCPLTGKPVIELKDPVRSMDCKHIYEKEAILRHIRSNDAQGRCPATGCPKPLRENRVLCDPLLLIEIEELRSMNEQSTRADMIEDFTHLDDED